MKRAGPLAQLRRTMKGHQRMTLKLIEVAERALRAVGDDSAKRLIGDHGREVLNAFLFIALGSYDLSVFAEELAVAQSLEKKRIYLRLIALHSVEFFDKVAPLTGSTLNSDTTLRGLAEESALRSAARTLRSLQRKYGRELRLFRNNVIAHRDLDGIKQLEMIRGVDAEQVIALATDLFAVECRLLVAYIALGARMSRRLTAIQKRPAVRGA